MYLQMICKQYHLNTIYVGALDVIILGRIKELNVVLFKFGVEVVQCANVPSIFIEASNLFSHKNVRITSVILIVDPFILQIMIMRLRFWFLYILILIDMY